MTHQDSLSTYWVQTIVKIRRISQKIQRRHVAYSEDKITLSLFNNDNTIVRKYETIQDFYHDGWKDDDIGVLYWKI